MENKINEWIKIDAELNEKLKDLEAIDYQREKIIKKAKESKSISSELEEEMRENLSLYNSLAKEIENLKHKAQAIKNKKN